MTDSTRARRGGGPGAAGGATHPDGPPNPHDAQYPDGAALFLGTMFAPVEDRDVPGQGFTHHERDMVTIATEKLGGLVNIVTTADRAPPWTFGVGALMRNLAQRHLL